MPSSVADNSAAPKWTIVAFADSDSGESAYDVATIIEAILAAFPGARVTAENAFEAERDKYRQYQEQAKRDGPSESSWELLIRDTYSKEYRNGPKKNVEIPLTSGLTLTGHVGRKNVAFRAEGWRSRDELTEFVEFLTTLGIGTVYTEHCTWRESH